MRIRFASEFAISRIRMMSSQTRMVSQSYASIFPYIPNSMEMLVPIRFLNKPSRLLA